MSNSRNWTEAQFRYHESHAALRASHPNVSRVLIYGPNVYRETIRYWVNGKITRKVPPGAYHVEIRSVAEKGYMHLIYHYDIFV